MKWTTRKVIPQETFTPPTNFGRVFQSIEDTNNFLKYELGEDYVEIEAHGFNIIEDEHCPRKCKIARALLNTRYESSDSTRQALQLRCIDCNSRYLVVQELDGK